MAYSSRRSTRLQGFDYTQLGTYYITLCTYRRRCLFGDVVDGEMQLSSMGEIVLATWNAIPIHFPHAVLDAFVVVPNHVHATFGLLRRGMTEAVCRAPTTIQIPMNDPHRERFGKPVVGSVPTIVRSFKSAVTRRINDMIGTRTKVWQRGEDERVVRNAAELDRIRRYIADNVRNWKPDR